MTEPSCLFIGWLGPAPSAERPFGLLELTSDRERCCYFLEPVASDTGVASALTELAKGDRHPVYRVVLDGKRSTCDCPSFRQRGHCKHLLALRLLHRHGRLPVVTPTTNPEKRP